MKYIAFLAILLIAVLILNNSDNNCTEFSAKLESCKAYKCTYIHPLTGEKRKRQISGIIDGKCRYSEKDSLGGGIFCRLPREELNAFVQYHRKAEFPKGSETSTEGKTLFQLADESQFCVIGISHQKEVPSWVEAIISRN